MLKAILSIVAIVFLATMVIPAYASHNAFDELDVYTNGTHYIFNKYIDNHLYGNSIVNYDGNQIVQTGTLRIDDTNANKWYPLPELDPGRYHWDWYLDTARTQDIDSITFTILEPAPEPIPEPIPEPTKSDVCHNGNTINVSSNALNAHLNHGDTLGQCAVPIPTNSTESNSPCGPGTIFDADTNSCILNKSRPIIPTQRSESVLICFEGQNLYKYGNDLRNLLREGATNGFCERVEAQTEEIDQSAPREYEHLSYYEIFDLIAELLDELKQR